jgi:hypothetical protein
MSGNFDGVVGHCQAQDTPADDRNSAAPSGGVFRFFKAELFGLIDKARQRGMSRYAIADVLEQEARRQVRIYRYASASNVAKSNGRNA